MMAGEGPAIISGARTEARLRSVMLLQEDARALDILRGVDAGALERCNDTAARFRLVLQVLDSLLAPLEFQSLMEAQVAILDTLENAVLLGVLARVDQRRAGEAGGRRN